MLDHMAALSLIFKGTSIPFSIVGISIYIPINSARGFSFLHVFSSIYCLYIYLMMSILIGVLYTHCRLKNVEEEVDLRENQETGMVEHERAGLRSNVLPRNRRSSGLHSTSFIVYSRCYIYV